MADKPRPPRHVYERSTVTQLQRYVPRPKKPTKKK
jgi:hypothetical protein